MTPPRPCAQKAWMSAYCILTKISFFEAQRIHRSWLGNPHCPGRGRTRAEGGGTRHNFVEKFVETKLLRKTSPKRALGSETWKSRVLYELWEKNFEFLCSIRNKQKFCVSPLNLPNLSHIYTPVFSDLCDQFSHLWYISILLWFGFFFYLNFKRW